MKEHRVFGSQQLATKSFAGLTPIWRRWEKTKPAGSTKIAKVPPAFSIIVMFSWMMLAPSQGQATPMFQGHIRSEVDACPGVPLGSPTCSQAAGTVVTASPFQALSPSGVSLNTNVSLPHANASGSLQVNSAGITVNGTAGAANPVNSPPGGWRGVSDFTALALNSYVLSSPTFAPGTIVDLTAQMHFSATLEGGIAGPEGGGGANVAFGPFVSYGPSLPPDLPLSPPLPDAFMVFPYSVGSNTAFGAGIETPGTLALTINEVGGQPAAVVTGSPSITTSNSFPFTLSPNATFPITFQATIGEPFSFGIAMNIDVSGGGIGCPLIPNDPFACNGQGTIIDPLSLNSFGGQPFILPANVTISPFTPSVPEPSTWLLLGSGLVGLASWRRRQRLSPSNQD